jgi:hypothetical protein
MKSNGESKYQSELVVALEAAGAISGILIVADGKKGGGFAVQVEDKYIAAMPQMLEVIAQQIREDLKQGSH